MAAWSVCRVHFAQRPLDKDIQAEHITTRKKKARRQAQKHGKVCSEGQKQLQQLICMILLTSQKAPWPNG